jgi:hypothetical protein
MGTAVNAALRRVEGVGLENTNPRPECSFDFLKHRGPPSFRNANAINPQWLQVGI